MSAEKYKQVAAMFVMAIRERLGKSRKHQRSAMLVKPSGCWVFIWEQAKWDDLLDYLGRLVRDEDSGFTMDDANRVVMHVYEMGQTGKNELLHVGEEITESPDCEQLTSLSGPVPHPPMHLNCKCSLGSKEVEGRDRFERDGDDVFELKGTPSGEAMYVRLVRREIDWSVEKQKFAI